MVLFDLISGILFKVKSPINLYRNEDKLLYTKDKSWVPNVSIIINCFTFNKNLSNVRKDGSFITLDSYALDSCTVIIRRDIAKM